MTPDGFVNVDDEAGAVENDEHWKISIEKIKEEMSEAKSNVFTPFKPYQDDRNTSPQRGCFENKPRMRICFDPEHEIPKLQTWFAENNHPSRLQVEEYVRILNNLDSRKGKKPLDINNVIYWFKVNMK